jgi:HK97 gp10 family phage protein
MRLKLRITRVVAPAELNRQIKPKFTNLMNAMGRRAQRLVPKRTWALHDTIRTDVTERGSTLIGTLTAGGGLVDYATFVERGTSRMAAQPYLRPALLQTTGSDFNANGPLDPLHGITGGGRRV